MGCHLISLTAKLWGWLAKAAVAKSTCGRALLRLYELTGGSVVIDGNNIADATPEELRLMRPRHADGISGPASVSEPAHDRCQHNR